MTKKILAIGNAIIDIVCKIDDEFLLQNNLVKGSMSLIDEETAHKLSSLDSQTITSGGSAGNTIAALAQLGTNSSFIGKVGDDEFGEKFISEISKTGVDFLNKNTAQDASAKSFILITPDAQRTMCTFLGCASQINEDDIKEDFFKDASILYLEGYLWDSPSTILALKKAINLAKRNDVKVAFSLSDSFCVSRHKEDFISLIINDLNIVFANEAEALEVSSQKEFSVNNLLKFFAENQNLTAIVTRSEKGCVVFNNDESLEVNAQNVENLMDTTGAGDAFAAGFLHGHRNNFESKDSAAFGNILASIIIQKLGARFTDSEINNSQS